MKKCICLLQKMILHAYTINDDHGGNGGDLDDDVADFDNETPGEPKKM